MQAYIHQNKNNNKAAKPFGKNAAKRRHEYKGNNLKRPTKTIFLRSPSGDESREKDERLVISMF